MRMNLIILSGVFSFFSIKELRSQNEFAPIGATWHFSYDIDTETPNQNYTKYQVVKDTIIRAQMCRKIEGIFYRKDSTINFPPLFVFQENDSVFYFNNHFDDFKLLYDFSAVPGDTLILAVPYVIDYIPNDTIFREIVDSVVIKDFEGEKIRYFYTHSLDRWSFSGFGGLGIYAEKIGNLSQPFLPSPFVALFFQSIRCYQDEDIFINFFDMACDFQLTTSVENVETQYDIKVYPNPGNHSITVESEELISKNAFISVFDLNGKLLISRKILNKSDLIDISLLYPGTYTLIIKLENSYLIKKIIKI